MTDEQKSTIFVAGASGAIGRRLCQMLVAEGWPVVGTTRRPEKVPMLRELGVEPAVVDVYDEVRLHAVVLDAQPDVVIHQLTDLPPALDPTQMAEALVRNARLRDEGTRNLIAAASAAGAKRLIAQSICFAYAPGPLPFREDNPLNLDDPTFGETARGVASLERQVIDGPFVGIVLRYGKLYGPGTGFDSPPSGGPLHVDGAADAALRTITRGRAGIYNIAEDDGTVAIDKAVAEFGWSPNRG
jgi:nucleoside-diphosphate-sugar epimerase